MIQHKEIMGLNVPHQSLNWNPDNPLSFKVIGHSNLGKGREKNQDAASVHFLDDKKEPHLILAVADGLGCYAYSEKAAYEAVQLIPRAWPEQKHSSQAFLNFHHDLLDAFPYESKFPYFGSSDPHQKIPLKKKKEDRGATTLVLAEIHKSKAKLANIGDSRAYLIRNQEIIRQTQDQSLVEKFLMERQFERRTQPVKQAPSNVILNALGAPEAFYDFYQNGKRVKLKTGEPIFEEWKLKIGDRLLLASDGFFNNFTEDELSEMICLVEWENLENRLIDKVLRTMRKGRVSENKVATLDNFTFLVYRHE